jgi:tRNA modification GTPase
VGISAASGAGLEDLERLALGVIEAREESATGTGTVGLGARHLRSLSEAHGGVERALVGLSLDGAPLDQVAEELRGATDALDGIAGRTTPEDLLDRIFAQFCLGK